MRPKTIKIPRSCYEEYIRLRSDPVVRSMQQYRQHSVTNTYDHCTNVTRAACRIGNLFRCKEQTMLDIVISGMLHDFYLYDYHGSRRKTGHWHAYAHPEAALENAERRFAVTPNAADAIRCHMFPCTLFHMPKHACGWIISAADKICAMQEILKMPGYRAASLVPA